MNYTTDKHEFTIEYQKNVAIIECKAQDDNEAFNNPISLEEFREMIITATIKGITKVHLKINYSMEVHSQELKYIENKRKIKVTRITE
jgi:hypothetical protein